MATGTALAAAPSCLNAGGTAGCALGRPRWEGRSQVHVGCFDSVLLLAPGLRPLSQACRAPPLGIRRSEAPRWRATGQRMPCASTNFDGRENEQAEARGFDASCPSKNSHRHGVPPPQETSTSGREFGSEGERRHTRRHPWARTAVRWASAILLGTALAVVNTQPAMAAWGFGGKGGVREAPRPGTVGLTDDQRRKQDEEAEARRAAEEEAARQARSQQENERTRARAAEQAQQEQQQAREGIIRNVEFFRERNVDTDEWELPLAVYEEAADAGLVDRSLLGWSKDTLRIRLRQDLGPLAEPEYLVVVPYTQKKRILDKYTGDVDVAAGVGLGADSPRNLFEELHYESVTGQGRGQNLARRKIDLLLKHYGEYGPFWFLSKDRIDPESLGFKDGEAAYLWIEYWVAALLAATWVWVMFVDKDQKTERYWDVRAVKEFRRQFQGADMNSEVTLRDVAGLDHVVDELQEVITFLKHPQKFEAMGARPPRGMLLYGAPGTGKTLLARAIAGEAKVPIIHVVASKFAMGESMVGVQAARLRGMFAYAKQRAPIVIFLDEIDGLCKKRAGARTDVFREQERAVTLNQLLVEMDGFNTYANKGILLIGATNNPSTLDPALTRPGRMDRIIEMPLPDTEGRVEIMTLYNKGWQFLGPIDLYEIAERGKGLTPADLAEIYEDAISDKIDHVTTSFRQIYDIYFRKRGPYYFLHPVALIPGPWQKHIPRWFGRAFRHFFAINPEDFQPHEDHCITQADLRRTIDFISLEKESKRGQVSDKLWAPTIWHTRSFKQPFAAGLVTTAWMATLLPNHPPIISMWLEKYEGESIAVVNIGTWESTEFTEVATRRMLEKMLVVLVSGYVGLRMLLPEEMHDTLLHVRDIKHAQRLAREMCASTGFSFDDDVTMWAGSVQGEANAARHIKKTKSPAMGWAKQQELREMGDVLVNLAINKAAEILIPQKAAMEELMERLMVHDRLEKEDIEAHMRKHNVQPVDEFWLTPGGRYSIPEPEGRRFSPGGIIPDPVGTPVDLGPKRLTLAALGTKYARKYKQIIKRGGYVPADRWDDPALEGKTWVSAPDFATENVLEVTVEKAGVGQF